MCHRLLRRYIYQLCHNVKFQVTTEIIYRRGFRSGTTQILVTSRQVVLQRTAINVQHCVKPLVLRYCSAN